MIDPNPTPVLEPLRIGIASDHGGFELKQELERRLREAGHRVSDFGAHRAGVSRPIGGQSSSRFQVI